ncbi:MAG: hypothetical protein QXS41_00325 [Candidatus Woesearchaeota archaeon]
MVKKKIIYAVMLLVILSFFANFAEEPMKPILESKLEEIEVKIIVDKELIYEFDKVPSQVFGLENKKCEFFEKQIKCELNWIKRTWYDEAEIHQFWLANNSIKKICFESNYKIKKNIYYTKENNLEENCFYNVYDAKIVKEKFPLIQLIVYLIFLISTFSFIILISKDEKSKN